MAQKITHEASRVLTPDGVGFFLCAGQGDYRIGTTSYDLYGYSKEEIISLFSMFPSARIDCQITTYNGGLVTIFNWLITCNGA
jgi:hypothetical protein